MRHFNDSCFKKLWQCLHMYRFKLYMYAHNFAQQFLILDTNSIG